MFTLDALVAAFLFGIVVGVLGVKFWFYRWQLEQTAGQRRLKALKAKE